MSLKVVNSFRTMVQIAYLPNVNFDNFAAISR